MPFERNVFINCPFDDAYMPLLRPMIFAIFQLGLQPRIALESLDSGQTRISKIVALIGESRFAIHDLSRLQATREGEYYRLNMPFEIGLDVGCRLFQRGRASRKRCLILEAERYRYQAALSDLSNSDIAVHGNDPYRAMAEVRNWLAMEAGLQKVAGPAAIWNAFIDFTAAHFAELERRGYSPADVKAQPIGELMPAMQDWVRKART